VDGVSRWSVVLDSLSVSSTNHAGVAWDFGGGAPDPEVEVRVVSDAATPVRINGPDDVFSIFYPSSARATNLRASDLSALLRFDVVDADVTDYEFIGACRVASLEVSDALSAPQQTLSCPIDASTRNSGFTLVWHLERF